MTAADLGSFWGSGNKSVVLRKYLLMFFASLTIGAIAPYNSDSFPFFVDRLIYWVGCTMFVALISGLVARQIFPPLVARHTNGLLSFILFTVALTLPASIWIISWGVILAGFHGDSAAFMPVFLQEIQPHFGNGVLWYLIALGQVWMITLMVIGPISLASEKLVNSDPKKPEPPGGYRFLKRLPPALGVDLLCLSMEDHYVRAHTAEGNTLILLRMADAVEELEGYPGMQVHRSWWVAKGGIKKIVKGPRKVSILLKNDVSVPVSHRRLKELKGVGFF